MREEEFGKPKKATPDRDDIASTNLIPDDSACHKNLTLDSDANLKVPIHDVGDGAAVAAFEVVEILVLVDSGRVLSFAEDNAVVVWMQPHLHHIPAGRCHSSDAAVTNVRELSLIVLVVGCHWKVLTIQMVHRVRHSTATIVADTASVVFVVAQEWKHYSTTMPLPAGRSGRCSRNQQTFRHQ